jgi:hypothetical protein
MMNQTSKTHGALNDLFFYLFCAVLAAGWTMNLIKLVASNEVGGMVLARFAGIFIPLLGAILGWL